MSDPVEEARRKHAEAQAKRARDGELARRQAIKDAQAKAAKDGRRPFVTSG